jgi:hypothetical protein
MNNLISTAIMPSSFMTKPFIDVSKIHEYFNNQILELNDKTSLKIISFDVETVKSKHNLAHINDKMFVDPIQFGFFDYTNEDNSKSFYFSTPNAKSATKQQKKIIGDDILNKSASNSFPKFENSKNLFEEYFSSFKDYDFILVLFTNILDYNTLVGRFILHHFEIPKNFVFMNIHPLLKNLIPPNDENLYKLGIPQNQKTKNTVTCDNENISNDCVCNICKVGPTKCNEIHKLYYNSDHLRKLLLGKTIRKLHDGLDDAKGENLFLNIIFNSILI